MPPTLLAIKGKASTRYTQRRTKKTEKSKFCRQLIKALSSKSFLLNGLPFQFSVFSRIIPSTSNWSKKNLVFYCFVNSFWLITVLSDGTFTTITFSTNFCWHLESQWRKKQGRNQSVSQRIRIRGSGSVQNIMDPPHWYLLYSIPGDRWAWSCPQGCGLPRPAWHWSSDKCCPPPAHVKL